MKSTFEFVCQPALRIVLPITNWIFAVMHTKNAIVSKFPTSYFVYTYVYHMYSVGHRTPGYNGFVILELADEVLKLWVLCISGADY